MKLLTLVSRCSVLMFYFECNRLQQNMRQQAEWMAKTNNTINVKWALLHKWRYEKEVGGIFSEGTH